MLSGVPIGGVIAALSALVVIPHFGWRWVFFLGNFPVILVLPVILSKLPESLIFLDATGRTEKAAALRTKLGLPATPAAVVHSAAASRAEAADDKRLSGIFSRPYVAASMIFAGSILIAMATDRWGSKKIVVLTFLGMAVALTALMIKMPQPPLLLAIALAGVGGHGGQILINRFVSRSYPARHRASALGWSLGAGRIGPIIIGLIVSGGSPLLGFAFFAVSALCAAVLLMLIPRTPAFNHEEE